MKLGLYEYTTMLDLKTSNIISSLNQNRQEWNEMKSKQR